jgi:hypothetical protein
MMETPNGNDRPVTRKDLKEALSEALAEAEARIEDRIIKAMDYRLETLETKLLSAFHGYGERTDAQTHRGS